MKCKYCGGVSLFFRISTEGLCAECEHLVNLDIEQRTRLIRDQEKAAEMTLNPASKISRMDIVVKNLDALAAYEKKGIATTEDPPSAQLARKKSDLRRLVFRTAKKELKETLRQVSEETSFEGKLRLLSAFRLKLESYDAGIRLSSPMARLEARVREALHRTQLSRVLETARNSESAGRKSEALTGYKEALKFLNYLEESRPGSTENGPYLDRKIKDLSA